MAHRGVLGLAILCSLALCGAVSVKGGQYFVPTLPDTSKRTPSGVLTPANVPPDFACKINCGSSSGRAVEAELARDPREVQPVVAVATEVQRVRFAEQMPTPGLPTALPLKKPHTVAPPNREEEEADENPDGAGSSRVALEHLLNRIKLLIIKLKGEVGQYGARGPNAPTDAAMDLRRLKAVKTEVMARIKAMKSAGALNLTPEKARQLAREYTKKAKRLRKAKAAARPSLNATLSQAAQRVVELAGRVAIQLKGLGRMAKMAVTGGGLNEESRAAQMRRELMADQARLRAALNGTKMSMRDEELTRRALKIISRGLQAANAFAKNKTNTSDINVALRQAQTTLAAVQLSGSSPAAIRMARAALEDLRSVTLTAKAAKKISKTVSTTAKAVKRLARLSTRTGNVEDAQKKIIFRLSRALRRIRSIVRRSAGPPTTKNTLATLTVDRLKKAQARVDKMTKKFKNADSLARTQLKALGKTAKQLLRKLKSKIRAGAKSVAVARQNQAKQLKHIVKLEKRLDVLEHRVERNMTLTKKARKGKKGKGKKGKKGKKVKGPVVKINTAVQKVKKFFDQLLKKEVTKAAK